MSGVDCLEVDGRDGLSLLPGHIGIAEYEVVLGIAQELSGSIQTLQNLPGSLRFLLEATATRMEADYVLVDMSPGLGSINQNLLATSDYFLVPSSPDFFSVMAVDSLARVLPRWHQWAHRAHSLSELRSAVYPFPEPHAKFLGTVIQRYRPRGGAPASAFQSWIDDIDAKVAGNLVPLLAEAGLMLHADRYKAVGLDQGLCLAQIPDFNSLIAKSQYFQTPVYALTAEQIDRVGVVLEATVQSRESFRDTFEAFADKIVTLTS